MTTPSWSGNRWRATHAAPRRDGKGSRRFQRWCCGVRLAALTFPPSPPSSPALRERKGEGASSPSPQPLPLSHGRSGRGREHPPLLRRPFRSLTAREEGRGSAEQGRDTIQITPLPRCGRGAGGEGDPHLPRSLFRSLTTGVEGEGSAEQGRYYPDHPSPAARERGRG
jgi:hypothetical protein